jgi:Glycogen recognition site of AMP-activated protein kinase
MDPSVAARRLVKEQYAAVRQALDRLDEQVLARYWGEETPVRVGFERFLGSLDEAAGRFLGDEEIFRRGQALRRRTGSGPAAGTTAQTEREPGEIRRESEPAAIVATAPPVDHAAVGEPPSQPAAEPGTAATPAAGPGTDAPPAAEQSTAPPAAEPGTDAPPAAEPGAVEVVFTLPAEIEADRVALCGEFNGWATDEILLEHGSDGTWRTTVALKPGRSYRYRYLLDGERWENAWDADRYEPNSYGSVDSVVIVE